MSTKKQEHTIQAHSLALMRQQHLKIFLHALQPKTKHFERIFEYFDCSYWTRSLCRINSGSTTASRWATYWVNSINQGTSIWRPLVTMTWTFSGCSPRSFRFSQSRRICANATSCVESPFKRCGRGHLARATVWMRSNSFLQNNWLSLSSSTPSN